MRTTLAAAAGLIVLGASLAPAADDAEFKPLFDGKTLSGWKMVNTQDNFLVRDGLLVMNKGKGWLATEKTFDDFELKVRYRFITAGADSGVFIRAALTGNNWTNRGYQIQNMDNQTLGQVIGMGVRIKPEDRKHDAELVKQLKKPSGDWNELWIRAIGKDVEVRLNGKTVATGDNLELTDGHIGLQAEGGVIEFQSIEIKDLP